MFEDSWGIILSSFVFVWGKEFKGFSHSLICTGSKFVVSSFLKQR